MHAEMSSLRRSPGQKTSPRARGDEFFASIPWTVTTVLDPYEALVPAAAGTDSRDAKLRGSGVLGRFEGHWSFRPFYPDRFKTGVGL